jgi:hypothetical protein
MTLTRTTLTQALRAARDDIAIGLAKGAGGAAVARAFRTLETALAPYATDDTTPNDRTDTAPDPHSAEAREDEEE